jgi:flavin reductase (DIM6/NTAB) family NADH-FMN oxidoreductase RutF
MAKRPWNRVDLPVYSISSKQINGHANMNIITYAQAVSMQPKQFVCAIYQNTKTLHNIQMHSHFILQILSAQQYRLIELLGKKSGKDINKIERLSKRKLLTEWKGFPILKDCIAVIEMKAQSLQIQSGQAVPDHSLFLCDVLSYKNLNDGEVLSLNILREKNLIRI